MLPGSAPGAAALDAIDTRDDTTVNRMPITVDDQGRRETAEISTELCES